MDNETNATDQTWQDLAQCIQGMVICPFGIISSLLSIGSVWRKTFKEKNNFFTLMLIIACLDLFFACCYPYIRCGEQTKTKSVFFGLVFSASLASDLSALALTIERCLALCWPQKMQNLSWKVSSTIRVIAALAVSLVSLVRMGYILDDFVIYDYLPPEIVPEANAISRGLSIFGDMLLPFILSIVMSIFSCKILKVVIKRHRAKTKVKPITNLAGPSNSNGLAAVNSQNSKEGTNTRLFLAHKSKPMKGQIFLLNSLFSANQKEPIGTPVGDNQKTKIDTTASVVSLVLILDLFFSLNQSGYCALVVAKLIRDSCNKCPLGVELYRTTIFVSDFVELLSRSVNFYFYVVFSTILRQEFLLFVSKIRVRFCGSICA